MTVLKFPSSDPRREFIDLLNGSHEFIGIVVDGGGVGRIAWSCEDPLRIIGMLDTMKTILSSTVGGEFVQEED